MQEDQAVASAAHTGQEEGADCTVLLIGCRIHSGDAGSLTGGGGTVIRGGVRLSLTSHYCGNQHVGSVRLPHEYYNEEVIEVPTTNDPPLLLRWLLHGTC